MNLLAASTPLLPLALAPIAGASDNVVVMWILGGAGAAVMANQFFQLYNHMKEKPPAAQTYATKNDCAGKHSAIDLEFIDIKKREARRDEAQELRVSAIHNRINEVLAAVSRLEGRVSR